MRLLKRPRSLTTAAGLATLMLLTGCATEPEADAPQTATSTPAATDDTATTTLPEPPAAPEKPAAMANDDEAGARAAADYFLALYAYTVQSNDVTLLDDFCYEASTFCTAVRLDLEDAENTGQVLAGGDLTWTTEPQVEQRTDASAYIVQGTIHQSASQLVTSEGSVVDAYEAEDLERAIYIYWDSGDWYGFDIAAPSETASE
ncbi:DUF6318 family protein [Sanguibacter antarcticus]|uniref:DUF6318 domain-containing protein n=1 Tax=Sanguibacter antarcticus TaxID=372484 RepID=A0A2A9E6G1_9MICO|nr:DUF6318 family protein [Sanguibacter antarcticus]PFG33925.1 hypothetical protein ATL42_1824 [Sanguibacter antarcticus]